MKPRVRKEERVPSLSGKEAAVLDLLLAKPSQAMYGLELVNVSAGRLKRGTIYVTLDRMEDKGLVESREEDPETPGVLLRRRLYRPTGYGRRLYELRQLMKDAVRLNPLAVGGAL